MILRIFSLFAALSASLFVSEARNPEPSNADTWTIKPGDTLIHIAENRYGGRGYAGFLEVFNRVDPLKLHAGKKLPTPDLLDALV